MIIFTNNPIAVTHFKQTGADYDVRWMATPAMEVLAAARTAIHQGSVLCSNPMSGVQTRVSRLADKKADQPIAINPYISLAVTPPQDAVDFGSVKRINEALSIYRKNARLRFFAHNDDAVMMFQMADMDVLLSVLAAL